MGVTECTFVRDYGEIINYKILYYSKCVITSCGKILPIAMVAI